MLITKLDAAKRQLEIAVRLYFGNQDPVSIHTLTAAAYNIIRDISKRSKRGQMIIKEQILTCVKPEFRDEFSSKINEAENFFKHANRDHKESLSFNPVQSEMLLWDACRGYIFLSNEQPPLFSIFNLWYVLHHENLFSPLFVQEIQKNKKHFSELVLRSRQAFFQEMVASVHSILK